MARSICLSGCLGRLMFLALTPLVGFYATVDTCQANSSWLVKSSRATILVQCGCRKKDEPEPAYQLRRYGWSAKLPLSILTDFEEFAVYDCRIKPEPSDGASKAHILYLTYQDYATRWEEIADIFSREAVLKGSFDRYAESKAKKGTTEVDIAFLAEIESWRELLAKNLASRNPNLSDRELNHAARARSWGAGGGEKRATGLWTGGGDRWRR